MKAGDKMLTTYEDELKDTIRELQFFLDNADKMKQETKDEIRCLVIDFMIELQKYLKENDAKTYNELADLE